MKVEKGCDLCGGSGWVCEVHTQNKWENSDGSTCCEGAGANCVCNAHGEVEWQAVHASTNPDSVVRWVQ